MADIHWLNPTSDDFNTAADWSTGTVPGAGDNAILDAAGAAFTVTPSTGETVNSIQLASNATLSLVNPGRGLIFNATAGTGSGANAGTINLGDYTVLALGSSLDNTGTITVNGGRTATLIDLNPDSNGNFTLAGGGKIVMSDDAVNGIATGNLYPTTLINVNNLITGAGNIYVSTAPIDLINESAGVIDGAGANNALILESDHNTVSNAGLLEGTGPAGLTIWNAPVDQSAGGEVLAGAGSNVTLLNVTDIVGGRVDVAATGALDATVTTGGGGFYAEAMDGVTVSNAGMLEATAAGSLTIQASVVANTGGTLFAGASSNVTLQSTAVTGGTLGTAAGGTITIGNGSKVTVDGSIDNAGTIALASTGTATSLIIDASSSLTGGGTVSLGGNAKTTVGGAKSTIVLTNVDNTITGSGQLGAGKLTLINDAAGVIDANAPPVLTIATGKNTIANAGLIETTGKGALTIRSAVANTGTIEANGGILTLDAAVSGSGAVTIAAGTLDIANAGAMEGVAFTGKTGKLELAASQSYGGAVTGLSSKSQSLDLRDIVFDGTTTESYSGSATMGTLTVTHGTAVATIKLVGNYLSSTFALSSDGHGGTKVVDPPAAAAAIPPPHAFLAAMAGFGAGAGGPVHALPDPWRAPASTIAAPRLNLA